MAKNEWKHLENKFRYDENGNKRTKAQINKLILENLNKKEIREEEETKKVEKKQITKYKYKITKNKIKVNIDGEEKIITQVVETDF